MKTIGEKIKTLRIQKKMTQQELADKIGVSYTTVSLYESDTRKPSFKAINKIADVFNVTPAYFFDDEQKSEEEKIEDERIKLAARNMKSLSDGDLESINALIKSLMNKNKEGN